MFLNHASKPLLNRGFKLNLPCGSPVNCKVFTNKILGFGPGNFLKSATGRYLATKVRIANVMNNSKSVSTATAMRPALFDLDVNCVRVD